MKLLVISNCRPNSGWGTYTDNLKQAVGDIARFVNLFGSNDLAICTDTSTLVPGNSRVRPIIARAIPRVYFRKLIQNIKEERKNGLIVHYAYNLLPDIGDSNRDVVTIHDLLFLGQYNSETSLKRLYSGHLLRAYLNYKHIITVSDAVKKQLLAMGSRGSIDVIHPPCPVTFSHVEVSERARRGLNLPNDKILILSPSNNKPWKNLHTVSEVMKKLGDKYMLIRVGPGIGCGLTFQKVDPFTLNLLYNATDVLLFPSLEEGFGSPLVEAMKTGLPAVVSDIDVFREIGSDAVEYVDPLDPNSIVSGIHRALDRKEMLRELGFKRSLLFSQEIFREKMLCYYNNVMKESGNQ